MERGTNDGGRSMQACEVGCRGIGEGGQGQVGNWGWREAGGGPSERYAQYCIAPPELDSEVAPGGSKDEGPELEAWLLR